MAFPKSEYDQYVQDLKIVYGSILQAQNRIMNVAKAGGYYSCTGVINKLHTEEGLHFTMMFNRKLTSDEAIAVENVIRGITNE